MRLQRQISKLNHGHQCLSGKSKEKVLGGREELGLLVSVYCQVDMMGSDVHSSVEILQVIIIAKLCQSCPGYGPFKREGRKERGGDLILCTNCHN